MFSCGVLTVYICDFVFRFGLIGLPCHGTRLDAGLSDYEKKKKKKIYTNKCSTTTLRPPIRQFPSPDQGNYRRPFASLNILFVEAGVVLNWLFLRYCYFWSILAYIMREVSKYLPWAMARL